MIDESFKFTQHNPDGSSELKIGNNNDLYVFLRDRMNLGLSRLEAKIYKDMRKELLWCFWSAILVSAVIVPFITFLLHEIIK